MTAQRLKKVGEVALVLALVVGTGYLGKLVHHNYVTHGELDPSEVRRAPRVIPATDEAGARAALPVQGRSRDLVLLVLRTTCPFCEQNMPNWDLLTRELDGPDGSGPEIVVLSASPPDETRAYLEMHGLDLPVRFIEAGVLPTLGLIGYPSTVAIDPATGSLSVWDGVLSDGDRAAIRAWAGVLDEESPTAAAAGGN